MPKQDDTTAPTLRDYGRVVWIRKWLVLAVTVVGVAGAFLFTIMQPKMYEASARLMYQQPTNIVNPNSGNSSVDLNSLSLELQSVGNTINTPAVHGKASLDLQPQDRQAGYSVTAEVLSPTSASSGNAIADVVAVTATASDPDTAARVANAYSAAVIALRKESEQERYRAAQRVVQDQMNLFQTPQSRLTTDYAVLSQQLRNLQIAEATTTGGFRIIVPATPPSAPSSPRPMRTMVLGFGIGLIAGIALAFVVGQFDTRVRTHRQVAEILRMPIVGRLPRIRRSALQQNNGLIVLSEPQGNVSEALRVLRSNLDWASIDDHLSSVLVTSCIKNEGKTLTICNLAITLARAGKRVLLVDADFRDPKVHRLFSLPNTVGLTSVILKTTPIEKAMQTLNPARLSSLSVAGLTRPSPAGSSPGDGRLGVLTSGPLPPNPGEVVASQRMASWIREISASEVDYVLIDAPPVLSVGDAGALAASVDGLLMVVNLEQARRPMLVDGREFLDPLPCRKIGIVTVGERLDDSDYYHYRSSSD
jgi:Mrp family chromosome partitioning ATPase/capsular polysaccharide biosynthesis protein